VPVKTLGEKSLLPLEVVSTDVPHWPVEHLKYKNLLVYVVDELHI